MATVLCSEGCRSRLCFETFFRWVLFGGNGVNRGTIEVSTNTEPVSLPWLRQTPR